MIELDEDAESLWARYVDDIGRPVRVELSSFLSIEGWARILSPTIRYVQRVATRSRINYLRAVALLGKVLVRKGVTGLPTSESGWQELVLEVQQGVILDPDSKATLKTRVEYVLKTINVFLSHLKEEGVIPIGVEIPSYGNKFEKVDYSSHLDTLLGETETKPVECFPTKLLCSISLARSDAAYLDEIHAELLARRKVLRQCLVSYFKAMVVHFTWGRQAIASCDPEEILSRIKRHGPKLDYTANYPNGTHYCGPSYTEGLARYLAVTKHLFGDLGDDREPERVLPRFGSVATIGCPLGNPFEAAGEDVEPGSVNAIRVRWMLGHLTYADVAVMTALLIMDHPRFTPEAVSGARLVGATGRQNLVLGDGSETFEVVKHRAKATKREHLTELGQEIIHFLIENFQSQRSELRARNSLVSDQLFICRPLRSSKDYVAANHMSCVGYISGRKGRIAKTWLGSLFPTLEAAGLGRGTISFKKIRNTEGVLEWFATGSIGAVSTKLGNKTRTVIGHYIPQPLLAAWNARLVRRFQNLWLCAAAANERYLLEITDFHSLSDLHQFLQQMLTSHEAGSSPLADRLHAAFGVAGQGTLLGLGDATLSIAVSKQTLTALYTYSNATAAVGLSSSTLNVPDSSTGLRPQQFLDLALLLRRSLPEHEQTELRAAHAAAEEEARSVAAKLNWANLMIESSVK